MKKVDHSSDRCAPARFPSSSIALVAALLNEERPRRRETIRKTRDTLMTQLSSVRWSMIGFFSILLEELDRTSPPFGCIFVGVVTTF